MRVIIQTDVTGTIMPACAILAFHIDGEPDCVLARLVDYDIQSLIDTIETIWGSDWKDTYQVLDKRRAEEG